MRRNLNFAVIAAVVATVLVAGGAMATAGSGVSATLLARSAFIDNVDLKVTVQTDGATKVAKVRSGDVVEQHIIIGPGGNTGWHTHPGPSLVIVTQGTVAVYDGDDPTCTPHLYTAGTSNNSFLDIGGGDVHMIRDESGAPAQTIAVQLVPSGSTRRIDRDNPYPGTCPS